MGSSCCTAVVANRDIELQQEAAKLELEKAKPDLEDTKPEVRVASRVLIIGAGFGGLGCAHALANADDASAVSVTLVDSKDYFSIGGTWQFVWTGRATLEQTKWPLAEVAKSLPGVDLRPKTTVQSLDLAAGSVTLHDDSVLTYDYLVLSTGVVSDASSIPGLGEAAVDVCNIQHVERAKQELQDFIAKAKTAKGSKPLFLVAIGAVPYKCPPLPFEVASLVDHELRAAGVREGARVVLCCPVPFPMSGPPPNPASEAFLPLLAKKGIEWMRQHVMERVEKESDKWKVHFTNGVEIDADAIFAIFPQRAPDLFRDAGLMNHKGFISVDLLTNRLQSHGHSYDNVYVVGDACFAMLPQPNQPHPKAGEFAWQMGGAVAANIRAAMAGGEAPLPSVRGGRCVAETGGGTGMAVINDLMPVLANPAEGKPSLKCMPGPAQEKLEWVNGYIERLYGSEARKFSPA